MDSVDIAIHTLVREAQIVAYSGVACMTVLAYNYLLTLDAEIRLIWSAPWKVGGILFFLTRYTTFVEMVLMFCEKGLQFLSFRECKVLSQTTSFLTLFEIFVAEMILALRVWAIWGNSRKLGTLLVLALLPAPALGIYFLIIKHGDDISDPVMIVYRSVGFCPGFTAGVDSIIYLFIYLLAFEAVILALTAYKAIQHIAWSSSHCIQTSASHSERGITSFVVSFFRDGLSYNTIIVTSTWINIIVRIRAPGYEDISLAFQLTVHSIGTSFMLLNLRKEALAVQGDPTSRSQVRTLNMRFAEPSVETISRAGFDERSQGLTGRDLETRG